MQRDTQKKVNSPYRPALTCFLFCAFGIALAKIFAADSHTVVLVSVFLVILFCILAFSFRSRFEVLSRISAIIAISSFGFLLFSSEEYHFENSELNRATTIYSGDAIIFGKVLSSPGISSSSASFYLETDSVFVDSLVIYSKEKIFVNISGVEKAKENFLLQIGQEVKLFADLDHIEEKKNPYEISYDIALKEKEGIRARAYLHSPFDLYIINSSQDLAITQKSIQFFQTLFDKAKRIISNSIDDSLTKGFVSAVVLGDKSGLTAQTLDDFQRSGLTHLLVVSGFNVSIVAVLVFYLLRLTGLSFRRLRIGLSMLAVLFYCLVVGLEPSVVRALIVIEFIFFARLLERKPDIGNLTAAAALVTILLRPYDLFDIGFQLSYGAVFSLVFLYPTFEKLFISENIREGKSLHLRWAHSSLQGFFGSLAVFLGLLPVFLYHFHRLSVIGLAINILGIPLAAIITILGFLLLPISFLSGWLASVYGEGSLWITKTITSIAHFSGSFEWSVVQLPRPQTILIVFYFAVLFYIIRADKRSNFFGRSILAASVALILLLAKVPFASSLVRSPDKISLLFFDVGQGDAMLLRAPNNKTYLVDFGGITKSYSAIADRTLLPFFKAEGITEINGGFITHMHIDHYGGTVSVLQNLHCDALYTSGEQTQGYAAYRLDSISQALHIPVIRVHQGDALLVDKDLHIYILNPESTTNEVTQPLSSEGMNHHSLALKVTYKNSSALLLGDIEAADEERLVNRYGNFLHCDIVKVAHHGSRTSSSQAFIKAAKPKFAVISVGKNNSFGHPTPEVIKQWIRSGASVLRTDKEGAMIFQSDGSNFQKVEWR